MIAGVGTDIVEVARVEKSIDNKSFIDKVFSDTEVAYCEVKANKAENYAARFAAKEAFSKALGTGFRGDIHFKEIEILHDALGKPYVHTTGQTQAYLLARNINTVHISLSHTKDMAIAVVVLETLI